MSSPLISIMIPAYKSRYLAEAIESCLSQSYSNFEIVIVDDASPENLYAIVQRYSDDRIRFYRNVHNCGAFNVVDNWNICLSFSKGEYVICMGDDDRLKPCCLDEYVQLINQYPSLNVYHAWTELIDYKGDVIKVLPHRPEFQGCMEMIWNHWNGDSQYIGDFCFKAQHLRDNGGFFKQPLAWASDDITTARAAAVHGIANTQNIAFQSRENSLTISKSGNNDIKIEAKLLEKKWFQHFFSKMKLSNNSNEQNYYIKLEEQLLPHYQEQVLLYIKEYLHESLFNIIKLIENRHHYGVSLNRILIIFIKVMNYEAKKRFT